ncbi:MAG: S9 family peptidase [Pseudomonadota bacterium]
MSRLVFLALSLLVTPLAIADDWPYPEDTPRIEPVNVGLAGERPADIVRYLMANGALSAAISPDGNTVAYTSRITGDQQLWLVDAQGGWPRQVTFGNGIRFFRWTPDSETLLIGRDADGNEREGFYLIDVSGERESVLLTQSEAFRSFGMFSDEGDAFLFSSTERNGRDFDIYRFDRATGQQIRLFEGNFGFYPRAWQPGGELVIVDETRGEDGNDVHLLNATNGEINPLFAPAVSAAYSDYAWRSDGSGFYLASNEDREFAGLGYYDLKQQQLTWLKTPDADIENVTLSHDDQYIAWTSNDNGFTRLHLMAIDSGEMLPVPTLPDGVYNVAFASAANQLMIRISGPATPGDVLVWDVTKAAPTTVVQSTLAGLSRDDFVSPEVVNFTARDGVVLQGLLYLPRLNDTDPTPPMVINVHGGPTAQARPNFRPQLQYLINTGIAVLDINVRGSTGFGKTYARLDNQEKRLDSVRDLADAVAFFAKDDRIDANRVAVMGGSYGGYMVNAVLGSYPGVFDAGVSMVGVSDWVRALEDASPSLKASDRIEYGDITEERWQRFYADNSPINNAERIDVPLLVQHGVNDPRDPVTESDRLVQKIRDNGGEVTYLRFPDEGHSLAKQKNRVAFYRAMAGFLEAQLMLRDIADE